MGTEGRTGRGFFLFILSRIGEITSFWCANGSDLVDRKTDGVELGRNNRANKHFEYWRRDGIKWL